MQLHHQKKRSALMFEMMPGAGAAGGLGAGLLAFTQKLSYAQD